MQKTRERRPLMSEREVAEYLGVHHMSLRNSRSTGRGELSKIHAPARWHCRANA